MKTRTSRLFRLSALAAGLCLAQAALAADPGAAPSYQALPAGNLCPAAADDSRYNTKYLGFFTHLVQAQDDWLFRTTYDLRTDFAPAPKAGANSAHCATNSSARASSWWWSTSRPAAW